MSWLLLPLAALMLPQGPPAPTPQDPREAQAARAVMVRTQLAGRDITDPDVLRAMGEVPRHRFVPPEGQARAYADRPLPIGHQQTISQPYIVALMTQLARPKPGMRVLDVGTGSGYQAAVLSRLVGEVYGIEILCPLADRARETLAAVGYDTVTVRCGDGYSGWPERAPFDAIILAAAAPDVPAALVAQLAPGGRLVMPLGRPASKLTVIEKGADGQVSQRSVLDVRFVPMTRLP